MCSRDICFLQSQIGDKDIRFTVLSVKPSGLSWLCLALQVAMTFLSNPLKALAMRTVTNGFPSVTSVLQYFVFKMFSNDVLFTAPSPSPGGDEKVILIFQRSPVNYRTALCIAYSRQVTFFIKMRKLCSILTILRAFARKLVQDYLVLVCFTLFLFPSIYIFLTHWRFAAILHWTSL